MHKRNGLLINYKRFFNLPKVTATHGKERLLWHAKSESNGGRYFRNAISYLISFVSNIDVINTHSKNENKDRYFN